MGQRRNRTWRGSGGHVHISGDSRALAGTKAKQGQTQRMLWILFVKSRD